MPFLRMLNLSNPDINAMVRDLIAQEQGEMVIEVREPTRTDKQNRHYFAAVVQPLAEALTRLSRDEGKTYSKDDVHYYLKKHWLPLVECIDPYTGEVEMVPQSTTKLTKSDFALLTEKGLALLEDVRDQVQQMNRKGRAA